jgi:phosphatidylglycerophosphate synthase
VRAALPSWDEYAEAWSSLHGGIDPRRARASVRNWLRFGYSMANVCARLRVKPGAVTAAGLVACVLTPAFAARGGAWAMFAAFLVVLTAAADTVDGALAVLTSHTTRLGYVYDAIVDRIGEACWLFALWLIGVPAYAVVAAGALSWLHEYARARANAAGMTEIGAATVGERPTRVVLSVLGIGMAGLVGATSNALPAGIATFAVAVWIVLAIIGFAQLFATIHHMLAGREWVGKSRLRGKAEPSAAAASSAARPRNLGLDPHYVAESRSRAWRRAARSDRDAPPAEAPRSPGAGPAERPDRVVDEDLLREISELDDLPGASVIYTSAAATEGDADDIRASDEESSGDSSSVVPGDPVAAGAAPHDPDVSGDQPEGERQTS